MACYRIGPKQPVLPTCNVRPKRFTDMPWGAVGRPFMDLGAFGMGGRFLIYQRPLSALVPVPFSQEWAKTVRRKIQAPYIYMYIIFPNHEAPEKGLPTRTWDRLVRKKKWKINSFFLQKCPRLSLAFLKVCGWWAHIFRR